MVGSTLIGAFLVSFEFLLLLKVMDFLSLSLVTLVVSGLKLIYSFSKSRSPYLFSELSSVLSVSFLAFLLGELYILLSLSVVCLYSAL